MHGPVQVHPQVHHVVVHCTEPSALHVVRCISASPKCIPLVGGRLLRAAPLLLI